VLDLKQLRYFVAVAETEHVGRAAEQLHISQSPLSRHMMQLEEQLGLDLFERTKQRIKLTPGGREFLADAKHLIAQADRVEARAHRLGQGDIGELTVGYVEGAVYSGVLTDTLQLFKHWHPEVRVVLWAARSLPQVQAVLDREVDCGLVYSVAQESQMELQARQVVGEAMVLAVPNSHDLANRREVLAADLDGQPWIALPRMLNPDAQDRFLQACSASGFTPDVCVEATASTTALELVAAGLGVALVQESLRARYAASGVTFIELPWFRQSVEIHAIWRTADRNPLVQEFVGLLDQWPKAHALPAAHAGRKSKLASVSSLSR